MLKRAGADLEAVTLLCLQMVLLQIEFYILFTWKCRIYLSLGETCWLCSSL